MIKACVFDMDGTVTNTLPTFARIINHILVQNGFSPIEEEKFKYFVGNGAKILIRRVMDYCGADDSLFDKLYSDYMTEYSKDYTTGSYVYDGMRELIDSLKSRQIKVALLSNRPNVQAVAVLNEFFGENYFDVLCGAVDGIPLKPDPTGLLGIFDKLNVQGSECLYVGDTSTDMQTGKSGGAFTIGVTWGFRTVKELLDNHADAIVTSPAEILDYIK